MIQAALIAGMPWLDAHCRGCGHEPRNRRREMATFNVIA
jgi:hypothetical protein